MVGLRTEFPLLQKLQGLPLAPEEVSTRRKPLHRMHDQVKLIELCAGRLKEVSRKTSRGVVENGRELCQCNGCRLIEGSGRAATQDHLLNRVLRLVSFRQGLEANCLARPSGRWKDWWLAAPPIYFLHRLKRRRVVHLQHGGIFDLVL